MLFVVTAKALAGASLLVASPTATYHRAVDELLQRLDLSPRVALRVRHFGAVPDLLAGSDLLAIVPVDFARLVAARHGLVTLPLRVELPPYDVRLLWHERTENTPSRRWLRERVRALLGEDVKFELEWVSVYTFACLRMQSFRDGRVLFAGDCAHGVSPFGARGANSGVQDADNLAWKLGLVLAGRAPDRLLDTYADEREYAADENILNSTRSTDFITPKSEVSRTFRDAVLQLARDHAFARRLVNSGRLSTPSTLVDSPLNTPDADAFEGAMVPGAPCTDAPVQVDGQDGWLLERIGDGFTLVHFGNGTEIPAERVAAFRTGLSAESRAAAWLIAKGYRILAKRFRTPHGEIDLVARRRNLIAFIEVKARATLDDAAYAVTPRQQQRIIAAAQGWLMAHPEHAEFELRFDAMLIAPRSLPRPWLPRCSRATCEHR